MSKSAHNVELLRAIGAELPTRDALLQMLHEQNTKINTLQDQCETLTREKEKADDVVDQKSDVIATQKKRIEQLEEYLRLMKHNRYGSSSEKNI